MYFIYSLMKLLKFLEFLSESVKEKILLPIMIQEDVIEKINLIDSDISDELIKMQNDKFLSDCCLISIGESEDTVKFTSSNKLDDYLRKLYHVSDEFSIKRYLMNVSSFSSDDEIWNVNRTEIKIGRLLRKILNSKFTDYQIELFVNKWKSNSVDRKFKIIKGNDILAGYNSIYYEPDHGGTLNSSCMNDCFNYVNFYTDCENCSMLILLNDKDLIVGRALVWKDIENRTIMDRVYYSSDKYYQSFLTYAKENGWYYKINNKSGYSKFRKDNIDYDLKVKISVIDIFKRGSNFPYMDTFYFGQNNILSNREPVFRYFFMQDTDGGYSEEYNHFGDEDHYDSPDGDDEGEYSN